MKYGFTVSEFSVTFLSLCKVCLLDDFFELRDDLLEADLEERVSLDVGCLACWSLGTRLVETFELIFSERCDGLPIEFSLTQTVAGSPIICEDNLTIGEPNVAG